MKYINEVRLRAEIERVKETHERNLDKPMERGRIGYAHGCIDCCDRILSFIDSLQQEPEADLEKEIENEWKECNPIDEGMGLESTYMSNEAFDIIARHFFELGQKDAANKFDEIEYNRNRAQEQEGKR